MSRAQSGWPRRVDLDRALPHDRDIGKTHAVGRQHAASGWMTPASFRARRPPGTHAAPLRRRNSTACTRVTSCPRCTEMRLIASPCCPLQRRRIRATASGARASPVARRISSPGWRTGGARLRHPAARRRLDRHRGKESRLDLAQHEVRVGHASGRSCDNTPDPDAPRESGPRGSASRRNAGSSRRPLPPCVCSSSARACARRRSGFEGTLELARVVGHVVEVPPCRNR